MAEELPGAVEAIIPITTPIRTFEEHKTTATVVEAVAVFPDRRRMAIGSRYGVPRLWDLKAGTVLEGHQKFMRLVMGLAISRDGQLIAIGDKCGDITAWHGETGQSLTQVIKAHSHWIYSLDFSPDGTVLATGSWDNTTKLWSTETWQLQETPIDCHAPVYCVRYSPYGELAIATTMDIQILNPITRESIANIKSHTEISSFTSSSWNLSLAWTPDGKRLLSGDSGIREWDTSTWQQVGDTWNGHTHKVSAIAVNSTGTLAASASHDQHVRLWRLSDRRTIAIFQHSRGVYCVTFSADDKHILSGGGDCKISEWAVPEDALVDEAPKEQASNVTSAPDMEIPSQDQDYMQNSATEFFGGLYNRPYPSQRGNVKASR